MIERIQRIARTRPVSAHDPGHSGSSYGRSKKQPAPFADALRQEAERPSPAASPAGIFLPAQTASRRPPG